MVIERGIINEFQDLKETVEKESIFLYFSGTISQDALIGIGKSLRSNLRFSHIKQDQAIKIFSVFIELMQNIKNYSSEIIKVDNKSCGVGSIAIGELKDNKQFFVICGNPILNNKVTKLENRINRLNSMSKDELKQFYRQERQREPDSDSKGAGIGFIEMARKSSELLEYKITPIDDKNSFFTLKVTV